jgi:hypothetical protein
MRTRHNGKVVSSASLARINCGQCYTNFEQSELSKATYCSDRQYVDNFTKNDKSCAVIKSLVRSGERPNACEKLIESRTVEEFSAQDDGLDFAGVADDVKRIGV